MRLLIERSVRRDFWGRRIFGLRLGVEAHPVELQLIEDNKLRHDELWCSSAFSSYETAAESAFQSVESMGGWFLSQAQVRRRLSLAREGMRALRDGFLEAHVTVADLLGADGIYFEGRDVSLLLNVEAGVRSGVEQLQKKLEMLARYEAGGGLIVENDDAPKSAGAAAWAKMR